MTELSIPVVETHRTCLDDERELIARAKHDRAAFGLLYRRHYRAIAQYIYRRVGDRHTTDDLVAEVFLAAMTALPRYRYRGIAFRSWLYRIATNKVNRWARRSRRYVMMKLDEALVAEGSQRSQDQGPGYHESTPSDDGVRAALLLLPARQQAALTLHYLEGLSIEETASVLGCRVGTVKSRLSRGRDALRERLTKRRN